MITIPRHVTFALNDWWIYKTFQPIQSSVNNLTTPSVGSRKCYSINFELYKKTWNTSVYQEVPTRISIQNLSPSCTLFALSEANSFIISYVLLHWLNQATCKSCISKKYNRRQYLWSKTCSFVKTRLNFISFIFLFNEASSNSDYTILRLVSNELQRTGQNEGDPVWSTIPRLAS